jgi:opacity protein-like surface antigen
MTALAAGAAQAQAPVAPRSFVEGVAQGTFGNVASQSFGVEFGHQLGHDLQLFVEAGQMRNVGSTTAMSGAQQIAAALGELQSDPVTFTVKEPTFFGLAGVRYPIALSHARLQPYLLGGAGFARVRKDVTFQFAGVDATNDSLSQYVSFGSDLSDAETSPMLSVGGGVAVPVTQKLLVDVQYRYGRIFSGNAGINTNRAGAGFGFRF